MICHRTHGCCRCCATRRRLTESVIITLLAPGDAGRFAITATGSSRSAALGFRTSDSELVINAHHSCIHRTPETIAEIKRILHEHLRQRRHDSQGTIPRIRKMRGEIIPLSTQRGRVPGTSGSSAVIPAEFESRSDQWRPSREPVTINGNLAG